MGTVRAQLCALLTTLALVAAAPRSAHAEPATAETRAAARARGEQGLRLFESKRWADAFAAFREADGLYHAPTLTLFMGHCRRNQGDLLEARALYAKLVSEPVPVDAPEQFRKAQAQARQEIEAVDARIPRIIAIVSGPHAAEARVAIDGAAVGAGALTAGQPVNPGRHEITVTAPGASARRSVTVTESEEDRVEIVLVAEDAAPVAPPAVGPRQRGSILPGAVALGLGGVGVTIGAITGLVAAGKISDIKSRCRAIDGAQHCLVSDIPAGNSAQTLVTVSTIGLVAGGAALLAGTALIILRPGGGPATAARLEIEAGPAAIHLRGSF